MQRSRFSFTILLLLVGSPLWAQPEVEAKRHFDAGFAAVQSASSEADYEKAIGEFEQAARLLPTWPEVFLNLGLTEEAVGRYGEAARSLHRYARLAPQALDAELRQRISDLDYRAAKDGSVLPDIDAFQDGGTPLGKAIFMNDLPAVELLLAKGADVNAPVNESGEMPIWWPLERENRLMFDLLLSRGANVNAKNQWQQSLLYQFVSSKNRNAIELLLDKGADTELKDGLGKSPFRVAMDDGSLELAELLHSKGANLETQDNSGLTPLAAAVEASAQDKIRFLLELGANPNVRCRGNSLIRVAAGKGQAEIIRLLISGGADPNFLDDRGTNTVFHTVLGNHSLVELLLSVGADLEGRDHLGETVLHTAARLGKTAEVEFLISKGAQLEAKNKNGNTPLALAQISNKPDTAALLLAKGASPEELDLEAKDHFGRTALHNASKDGDVAAVEQLLNRGADLHTRDMNGLTPLHIAANVGHRTNRHVVELLTARGADLNAKDAKGFTPIGHALQLGHLAIVDYLHSKGAVTTQQERAQFLPPDPKAKDREYGRTWLFQAVLDDERETAERLLAIGADVNVEDRLGSTPLGQVMGDGADEMLEWLLSHGANPKGKGRWGQPLLEGIEVPALADRLIKAGADLEAKNRQGETALVRAIRHGNKPLVELLLAKGANLEAVDENSQSRPIHTAVEKGQKEIVELLLQLGAQTQAQDDRGKTPLDIARDRSFSEIEQLLVKKQTK